MLERDVYSTQAFKDQAKYFVFCKINGDEQPAVKDAWGVTGYPTIKFLTKDLQQVHEAVGYRPTAQFIAEMDKARGSR
jgi:hypothetical protein